MENLSNFRQVFITYIDTTITYDTIMNEMREICGFPRVHPFTIKWVDEEGDPCTIRYANLLVQNVTTRWRPLKSQLNFIFLAGGCRPRQL